MPSGLGILTMRELKKWLRFPFPLLGLFVVPIVWVFIFGSALNAAFSSATQSTLEGAPNYFNFMATGMAVSMSLTYAGRAGASLFTDRFTGYLDRLKVSPATRSTIIISKVFGGMILGMIQALVLIALSVPIGLDLQAITPISLVLIVGTFMLLSFGFCCVFIFVSLRIRRWQTQQLIGPLVVTPLQFLSSVFYPASRLPTILKGFVYLNPLSYAADASRVLFFTPSSWLSGTFQLDFFAMLLFAGASALALLIGYKLWL